MLQSKMNMWGRILSWFGWKVEISAPRRDKCVICVAPHTSNWDFLLGLAAYKSLGREANFLMKEFWFFFPFNLILNKLGGIPVPRKSTGGALVSHLIDDFKTRSYINLAVTPEGTRSKRKDWRTGFLRIAYGASVPIQLGVIDYSTKKILIEKEIFPTGNLDADMLTVKNYYTQFQLAGKYPDKFAL